MEKKNSKTEITRKEALQRMGKYAALTAVGTFLILNPKKAHASSLPADPGGDGWPAP
ncbi:hypothetical protein M8845_04225 [Gelidibacter japonicus]|uniref:hypothetical protein n=1 Tax=Gelidibacter japonicus TaxID=1962232 RepID=UPI002021EE16|nr:hypothetical protein [Gelidibacter japonicus]MCL8006628.1 hypothetical protein [Gelidibacter japonicus]